MKSLDELLPDVVPIEYAEQIARLRIVWSSIGHDVCAVRLEDGRIVLEVAWEISHIAINVEVGTL